MEEQHAEPASFIVRLSRDEMGRVSGIVERVRTGQRARFVAFEEIGHVIAVMMNGQ